MNTSATFSFQWLSPMGTSVALFIIFGLMGLLFGIGIPIISRRAPQFRSIVTSRQADARLFGHSPEELFKQDPILETMYYAKTDWLSGMWMGFGLLQLGLTWFGLRNGQHWALWTLTIGDIATAFYSILVLWPYYSQGVPITLFDLPPVFLYPMILIPIAAVLGWIGLR